APLVVASIANTGRPSPVPRNLIMRNPAAPSLVAFTSGLAALAAFPLMATPTATRSHYRASGVQIEANDIQGDRTAVHATGSVVLTSSQGDLRADRVDAALASQKAAPGAARSAVREATAIGHVRMISQSKPDEKMEATGAAGSYWPAEQKATLTG